MSRIKHAFFCFEAIYFVSNRGTELFFISAERALQKLNMVDAQRCGCQIECLGL